MPFTKDQQKAIETRDKNLLVAAAAGSGKTTVLVERVLRLVEEGANIDEMLIVTFTRAASADMREKLRKKFSERASNGDARAREQMERLESASISTIHAFCTELLRQNFEAAGIDPQFRILDDAEDRQLTDRCMDEALEAAYEKGGEAMDALDFARGPEKVRELALSMHAFLRERPDAEKWMENAFSLMDGDGEIWTETLLEAARQKIREAEALNEYGVSRALLPEGPAPYAESMREDGKVLSAMLELSYDALSEACSEFKPITPRTSHRKKGEEPSEAEEALKEEVMDIRKQVKSRVENAWKLVSVDRTQSKKDIRDNRPCVEKLYEIARDLDDRLTKEKRERAALTFSDLERYALMCLSDDRAAARARESYRTIFVDEYQDTSDVQEAIVSRIAGERNRFMVGDVKQSIYRFRQAEPKLFLEKYASYREGGDDALIVLSQNFRSRASVIDFVNHVFSRVMNGGASEIEYGDDQKLYPGAMFDGPDEPTELLLIDKAAKDGETPDDEETVELNDAEKEGLVIARRIRALMNEDPSLRYRDICVLTRVGNHVLPYLASAMASEGVPAYADASESYFDALEVMEIISALRLIANRRRDIDLISVLRSPLFGMSTRELALIRAETRADSFWDALTESAETNEKSKAFLLLLDDWRALSRSMTITRLIRRILSDTGFYAYVGALPGGEQRQANLDVLCARAAAYEAATGGSLCDFLDYTAGMRARGDGDGAHVLGENDDVVRLMTAHKSKGLEFPVVFMAMLGKKYRSARAGDALIAHRDLGMALMRMDERLQTRRDTVARQAILQKTAMEDRAEELRVLYVALTRAKSRLILTGTSRNLNRSLTSWRIARGFPDLYQSNLDIVAAASLCCPGAEILGGTIDERLPRVNVKVFSSASLSEAPEDDGARAKGLELLKEAMNAPVADPKIEQAILWKYPNPDGIHAPVKLTASGLSREIIGAEVVPDIVTRPAFLSEHGLTATERGTAVHAALRAVDYAPLAGLNGAPLRAEVERQLAQMHKDGRLSPAEFASVSPFALTRFLASPLGIRLRASDRVEREWRFNLRLPASEAVPGAPENSEVIVQGSIDLCFMESSEWVLVDYKTDRTLDTEEITARYAPQLTLYARALHSITGIRVKEALICLVSQGETLPVSVSPELSKDP